MASSASKNANRVAGRWRGEGVKILDDDRCKIVHNFKEHGSSQSQGAMAQSSSPHRHALIQCMHYVGKVKLVARVRVGNKWARGLPKSRRPAVTRS